MAAGGEAVIRTAHRYVFMQYIVLLSMQYVGLLPKNVMPETFKPHVRYVLQQAFHT